MSAISLLAKALPTRVPPEVPTPGVCCVTGEECEETIGSKHSIKPTFTNVDLLQAPNSQRVGVEAWTVLNYTVPNPGKSREKRPLQQSSWICTDKELILLNRQEVRDKVLDGVEAKQWCGYVTTSYKKHGALRAPANTDSQQVWLFEMLLVDCTDRDAVTTYWQKLRNAQNNGIPRPLIESLDISPGYIGKIGLKVWTEFEVWAKPRRFSPLYQFMAYLLPSQQEIKDGYK